ncbi:MAG: TIM barrel protein [Rhodothermaceae bacterium]|nr:TIM barrel protein [Rhodothermaceae bacterium]MYB91084.1 TIM barrel protein [Rhodothermaceae bacterium]MYD67438.1 TIM barrel protein [Rhodothermaceae bacterium]MYG45213.1 TIM barrel protein [Rhodothermaceae bacterium]MYJ08414.1 TIM barrel protein [Rhodothermaceae bacterium]
MKRRSFIETSLTGLAGASLLGALPESHLRGRINHSVCKWCYPDYSVEELVQAAATMGLKSVELLEPDEWPILEKYGLVCAMPFGPVADGKDRLTDGFNEPNNHEWLVPMFIERIREVAEAGYDRVICFSGNRRGMGDAKGLENCVHGLEKIVPVAEQHGITLCMELLNSKVSHPDYMCDHTVWGVELCKQIGSEYFKLLYDIYHMQVMEGDVIRTIRDNHQFIGHYHTGGNPGRNEIDDSQELNYPAIMRAIVETGYTGFVGQEFIPTRTPLISLREAVRLCDV